VEKVDRVAYVSEEGRNDLGYNVDYTAGTETRQAATSWGTASNDLQAVINSWTGTNFDEIWVQGTVTPKTWANATGGYQITDTGDPKDKAFVIPPGLKIYGGFGGTETDRSQRSSNNRLSVLSGLNPEDNTNARHVVVMADIPNDQETVLDGLTISGGIGADSPGSSITVKNRPIGRQSGAGVYLVNASPILENIRVQGNTATANGVGDDVGGGGGIYNIAMDNGTSSPRLTSVVIYNNSVSGNGAAGGMYNFAQAGSTCNPILDNVIIELNQCGGGGGGLYINATGSNAVCAPVITNSLITRNAATNGAGVLASGSSTPTFTNVVIRGNNAGNYGGGILNDSTLPVVFTNATIAGNTAGNGGGVENYGQYLVMTNITISGNRASNNGGGFFNFPNAGAVLINVLLEGNQANNGGGAVYTVVDRTDRRTVLVITNGVIKRNRAGSGGGGGIANLYYFSGSANNANTINYVALTNVLITENEAAGSGGGIHNYNQIAATELGKGIKLVMNNVTIASNVTTAGPHSDNGGGGINNSVANTKITVTGNNCIIWNNTAPNNTARANICTPDPSYISLTRSLAQNGSYTGTNLSFSGSTPFANGGYTLDSGAAALIDAGNNDYPDSMDDFLGGNISTGALDNTVRYNTFTGLITNHVITTVHINKDATAALGDRTHTTTVGTTGDVYSVNVSDIPPSTGGADKSRKQGTAIDVGAYENQ
jgi:hypothetical protein